MTEGTRRALSRLRTLRVGAVLVLGVAVVLALTRHSGMIEVADLREDASLAQLWQPPAWIALGIWPLWGLLTWYHPYKYTGYKRTLKAHRMKPEDCVTAFVLPTLGVTGCTVYSLNRILHTWYEFRQEAGIDVVELLVLAVAVLGVGMLVCIVLLVRGYLLSAQLAAGAPRRAGTLWATLLTSGGRPAPRSSQPSSSRRLTPGLVALALTPALVVGAAVAVPYPLPELATQVTAPDLDDAALRARPTSFAPDAAWSQEAAGVLDVAAGAAGPILLTDDGVTALDPTDGSTRWSYRREGATYVKLASDTGAGHEVYLVTSPDGRHVAVRIEGPGDSNAILSRNPLLDREHSITTIVLDAVSGEVVGEYIGRSRPSITSALQLTDSAVLSDETAYSLTDGSQLWTLDEATLDRTNGSTYSGTAGHSTFVLGMADTLGGSDSVADTSGTLLLLPETDPTAVAEHTGVMTMIFEFRPLVVGGWTVVATEASSKDSGDDGGRRMHAESLDALAGVPGADTQTYDLGPAAGINPYASWASGTLAVLPAEVPESQRRGSGRRSPDFAWEDWEGAATVGAAFDPATRTVTTAGSIPGPAAAAVGVTSDGGGEPRVTVRDGVGDVVSLPATVAAAARATDCNPDMEELAVARYASPCLIVLSTPGTTVVLLADAGTGGGRDSRAYHVYGVLAKP